MPQALDEMGMLKVGDVPVSNSRAGTQLSLEMKRPPQNSRTAQSPSWIGAVSGRWSGVRRTGAGYSPLDDQEATHRLGLINVYIERMTSIF